MHDLEQFRDLASRALEHPADASLRAEVAAVLALHPDWTEEWRLLREAHALARAAVPAALARAQAEREAVIPADRLKQLMRSRPQRRVAPQWLVAAAALLLLAGGFAWSLRSAGQPDLAVWARSAPPSLARALTAPLAEVVATAGLPTLRNDAAVYLRSPVLAASAGPVVVDWIAPGHTGATLVLRENNRIIWTQPGATSPSSTPALKPDGVYELTITPANGPALSENFVTVAPISSEATGLERILTAVTTEPARLGEAVLAWHALPERARHSEAGVRLGLWLGVQARQPDLLAEATTAAARLH